MNERLHLAAHQLAKFRGAIPFSSKVMVAHTLHFKPILTPLLQKKLLGELPFPVEYGLARLGACKKFGAQHPLGAEIWSSK